MVIDVLIVFFVVVAVIIGAVHYRNLGSAVIRERFRFALGALRGDVPTPWPPMGAGGMQFETQTIDSPLEAAMLQGSKAERRYYAMLELWDSDIPHEVERYVYSSMMDARNDALMAVRRRMERITIEKDFTTQVVFKDPVTDYRVRYEIDHLQQAKFGVPESYDDRAPERILDEVLGCPS